MKTTAKGIAGVILFLPILFHAAQAGWPIFSVPSPTQVKSQIITEDCPRGEGKIPVGTKFPFKSFNQTWYWEYSGSSNCQKLTADLNYVDFKQNGNYSGNKITTSYGTLTNAPFRFDFTIPYCDWGPECSWYCAPISDDNPPTVLSCSYDQLKH
jgi:hypothetical protein